MAGSEKQPVLIALGVVGLIILGYMGYRFITGSESEPVTQEAIQGAVRVATLLHLACLKSTTSMSSKVAQL